MRLALLLLLLLPACLSPVPRINHAPQRAPTRASLRGVSAVSPRVCWASGSGGTFLRTIDGGKSWAARVVPGAEELDFRDVEALDANTAVLLSAGRPGEIWRTADGGVTWRRTYRLDFEGVFLDAMDFDGERGIAWGDPIDGFFLTLRTEDAGLTWRRVGGSLPRPEEGEAGFAASGTCVSLSGDHIRIGTGGSVARVLSTSDAGLSWTSAATPLQQGAPSQGIFSLVFLNELRGAAVGGDYEHPDTTSGTAAFTVDGGLTWTPAKGRTGYRSCVARIPLGEPQWLMSISKVGASVSLDAGASWRPIGVPGHYALDFAPDPGDGGRAVGWAVGADGSVLRVEVWD